MTKVIRNISCLVCFVIAVACQPGTSASDELPIARVFDNYLYPSDIVGITQNQLDTEDSLVMAREFIEKWVRKQLLVHQAELNLSEEDKNVEQQIDDYRTSLLIYKFEQKYIQNKLDTVIARNEIEAYYNNNASNFLLKNNIVKALYIKIPRESPEIWKVRQWYRKDDQESVKQLDQYCFEYATTYDHFDDNWIYFTELIQKIPVNVGRPEYFLRYRKFVEANDSLFYYFIKINDYKLTSTVAPLDYVEENIRSIILNKRRIQLANQLESEVYNEALNRDQFNIY
jgi:hypothetical protein